MLCLMHEADPYGHLLVGKVAPSSVQLATLCMVPMDQVDGLLLELETHRVFSRTRQGVVYSRRMVDDNRKYGENVANGKKGGNPKLRKQTENSQGVNPTHKAKSQTSEVRDQISTPSQEERTYELGDTREGLRALPGGRDA